MNHIKRKTNIIKEITHDKKDDFIRINARNQRLRDHVIYSFIDIYFDFFLRLAEIHMDS